MITISSGELLARIETLTPRETEILGYILKGLSNDQIALAICRSPKTVDKHCQRIYRKLDVHRRVNLVRLCLEAGYPRSETTHYVPAPLESKTTPSSTGGDAYSLIDQLIQKGRAWDQLDELERILSPISGPRYFGELVCALTKVFGVKYAGISEHQSGDSVAVVIAYSVDGELSLEMDEYDPEATPCENTLRDSRYFIPEGACSVFPHDEYLIENSIDSYAGVRLDDRILGTLGLIWICDTRPMRTNELHLEVLSLIALSVAAELGVQVVLDQAGEA